MKKLTFISIFLSLTLVGCGQTGALYHPQEQDNTSEPEQNVTIHGDGTVTRSQQ